MHAAAKVGNPPFTSKCAWCSTCQLGTWPPFAAFCTNDRFATYYSLNLFNYASQSDGQRNFAVLCHGTFCSITAQIHAYIANTR
jgi:hypothetical protein